VEALPKDRIEASDLTVAIDPGNGAGSLTSPRIFRELGCRVVTINAQPDGGFSGRDPEPVRENLTDLCSFVRAEGADLGVAHDGDADRAVFVDEQGSVIDGETALAALAASVVTVDSIVVGGVNASQRLVDVVTDAGGSMELTRVGSTFILNRVRELLETGEEVPIAGEGNGGIIFPAFRLGRDGAFVAGRFLDLIRETPASEVVRPFSTYFTERVNVPVESSADEERKLSAINQVADTEVAASVSRVDGFRFDYGDEWVLVRSSSTEPLIRVYAEARSQENAQGLARRFEEILANA
jgi:phosphomannomutase/phosphoglucomutase